MFTGILFVSHSTVHSDYQKGTWVHSSEQFWSWKKSHVYKQWSQSCLETKILNRFISESRWYRIQELSAGTSLPVEFLVQQVYEEVYIHFYFIKHSSSQLRPYCIWSKSCTVVTPITASTWRFPHLKHILEEFVDKNKIPVDLRTSAGILILQCAN